MQRHIKFGAADVNFYQNSCSDTGGLGTVTTINVPLCQCTAGLVSAACTLHRKHSMAWHAIPKWAILTRQDMTRQLTRPDLELYTIAVTPVRHAWLGTSFTHCASMHPTHNAAADVGCLDSAGILCMQPAGSTDFSHTPFSPEDRQIQVYATFDCTDDFELGSSEPSTSTCPGGNDPATGNPLLFADRFHGNNSVYACDLR